MDSYKLLDLTVSSHPGNVTAMPPGRHHKANGPATAALLIQLASELLETSPTIRKRMGVTLSDLAAADKVRKKLLRP